MARPTKRTPEREQRLLGVIRAGATKRAACASAGITEDTLANWLRRYSDFSDLYARAEAEAEVTHNVNISRAARAGDWRASAWWLERRRPTDYARHDRVDVKSDITVREVRQREAERLAAEYGLDPAELLAEAERIDTRIRQELERTNGRR
jgi:hypothetical protein